MKTIDMNTFYAVIDAVIRYGAYMYNESQCYLAMLDATKGDKAIAEDIKTMIQGIYAEKNAKIPSSINPELSEDVATYNRIGRKLCEVFNANDYYYGGNVYNHEIDMGAHVWVKPETNVKGTPSLRFTEELDLFKYFVQKAEV